MIITLVFIVALASFIAWWLLRQGLAEKPWLETGVPGEIADTGASRLPRAKIGLGVFLTIATGLLVLLVSAYSMRIGMEDWRPLPWPRLLLLNTGLLIASSFALHRARKAAHRLQADALRSWLMTAGLSAIAFVTGQILAWRQLIDAGYRLATNPADAFFYLITAVHALHVLGGLVALLRIGIRLHRGAPVVALRLSVDLCATYWHFLLVAWILLFALLAYAPSIAWLYAICTAPFG